MKEVMQDKNNIYWPLLMISQTTRGEGKESTSFPSFALGALGALGASVRLYSITSLCRVIKRLSAIFQRAKVKQFYLLCNN